MRNRYLLCLLLCAAMFYIALPRLNPTAGGLEGLFSVAWLSLAITVAAGNLSALFFARPSGKRQNRPQQGEERKRLRAR